MNHPWEDPLILDLRVRFSSVPNLPWIWTLTSQFTGGSTIAYYAFMPLSSSLALNLITCPLHSFLILLNEDEIYYVPIIYNKNSPYPLPSNRWLHYFGMWHHNYSPAWH